MAEWKKIIVSGSDAHLASVTASNLTNDQLVIGGTGGALESSGLTYDGTSLDLTAAAGGVSGSFSGSFEGNGSGLTDVTATLSNALTDVAGGGLNDFTFDGSSAVSLEVSGAVDLTANTITKWDNTSNKFVVSSLTDDGTNITGTTSIQLTGASSNLSGSFSGSFEGDGTNLTGIATTLNIDAKENASDGSPDDLAVDLKSETLTLQGTANEVEVTGTGQTVTIGLPNNVTIGSNLNVTGDLTVSGTTTTLNTTNLLVEDRFALFNSGSNSGDGGFIVQTETDFSGAAFGWDDSAGRFAFQITTKLAQNATAITPDAYAAAVVTSDTATYRKNGNIRVESGDIFIYVE